MIIRLGETMTPPYRRTPKQREILTDKSRFKCWKGGRRGAKTYALADFSATQALTDTRKFKHWYVTKTLSLARDEFFPALLNLLPRDLVRKVDDRSLTAWLTSGSSISCKSAEKEDNLRGRALGSVVMDEAAFVKGHIWDAILRPQLSTSEGPAILASSPKKGWFTTLFNKITTVGLRDWACFHSTIYDNPHVKPDEIEAIKATTPLNTWLQEYMAQEVSDEGQVYEEFSATTNVYDPKEKFKDVKDWVCIRGLDWGRSDDTGVVWLGISPEGYLVISDEHAESGWDPSKHADVIHGKSQGYKKIAASVLDRTAFRSESDGTSVGDQFKAAGVSCQPSERDVDASINIVKRFLRGDGATPWLYVSVKCPKLIEALQNWEHGDHEPDIAAAMRYAATWAVMRKMTRLYDAKATYKHDGVKVYSEKEAAHYFAAEARIVPTKKARGFAWNFDAGSPL